MTKLEEVARAIYDATKQDGCAAVPYEQLSDFATGQTQKMARAAIQALREPPEAIVLAMIGAAPPQSMHDVVPFDGPAIFSAAIDAILNEKP